MKYRASYNEFVIIALFTFIVSDIVSTGYLNSPFAVKMSSKDSKGSSDSLQTKTKKKDKTKKGRHVISNRFVDPPLGFSCFINQEKQTREFSGSENLEVLVIEK